MEREKQETKRSAGPASTDDDSLEKGATSEESVSSGTFQTLRTLLEKARRNQQGIPSRRELSRD
jgi:hypothetical protein